MVNKIGTVADLVAIRGRLPPVVYKAIHSIVEMLDKEYGATRNVDTDDGGYVLYINSNEDLDSISLCKSTPEEFGYIDADKKYICVLYLSNNEYGITLIAPTEVALQSSFVEI